MPVTTWHDMSEDAMRAARTLFGAQHYRSCASRAYYAAYCAATEEILKYTTTFTHGWNNPSHKNVPSHIQNTSLSQVKKDSIKQSIDLLRLYREDDDYRPSGDIDISVARDLLREAASVQYELWGIFYECYECYGNEPGC